jgi:DNA-nicking Smr family endonuclease
MNGDPPDDDAPDADAPHVLPIEDQLDLHAFHPRDITGVVHEYLAAARAKGLREVRLIHGKGIGAQRERVRGILATHPDVERFTDAPAERGHWGATIAWLRSPEGRRGS